MLRRRDGSVFATGMSSYLDEGPGHPGMTAGIHVRVKFEGVPVIALLDTGASWSVLRADLAQELGLLEQEGEPLTLSSRVGTIDGQLVSARIALLADDGESVELDSTVFVSRDWPAGNFIGYSGLLERIKFAIDPGDNRFFFGER